MSEESCTVRFVVINDVYHIDNFPYFASAKKVESIGPNLTIGTLAGDFLSPSLLSTIDKGVGIVECMGLSGVDYVCFGLTYKNLEFFFFLTKTI